MRGRATPFQWHPRIGSFGASGFIGGLLWQNEQIVAMLLANKKGERLVNRIKMPVLGRRS
jgi:hypothetical protein